MYTTETMATAKKAVKKEKSGTFAVIANGGKQYLVRSGDVVTLEKMNPQAGGEFKAGDAVSFDQVLLKDTGSITELGAPFIKGLVIAGEFVASGRAKKIDVIQYKQKSRYYKKKGHRQPFVKVKIGEIK